MPAQRAQSRRSPRGSVRRKLIESQSSTESTRGATPTVSSPRQSAEPTILARTAGSITLGVTREQKAVLRKCGDDDPAVVFDWNHDAIAALALAPNRPPWAAARPLPSAIVERVATLRGGSVMGRMGHTVIAPMTLAQSYEVKDQVCHLCFDPWVIASWPLVAAHGPLATIYFVADGKTPTTGYRPNIALVPVHGVQAFA